MNDETVLKDVAISRDRSLLPRPASEINTIGSSRMDICGGFRLLQCRATQVIRSFVN
jgi:hypothetical protein